MFGKQFSSAIDDIADPSTPPEPSDSRDVKIKKLRQSLADMKRFPVPHVMRSFSQWLADLVLGSDMWEGVYHLTESHGIALRQLLESCWIVNPATTADGRRDLVKCVKIGRYDGVDGMKDRLGALPQEWTVVQLTAGGVEDSEWLWLSLLPTGPDARRCPPAARQLPCPPGLPARMSTVLDNKTNHVINRDFRTELEAVLKDLESWIGRWRFLLCARLEDRALARKVRDHVECAIARLSDSDKTIALRLAEAPGVLSAAELELVLSELGIARADWPDLLTEMPLLATARRQTLVLILDQTLDMFPWEGMSVLREQPVTRIESLHILHMLHTAHLPLMSKGFLRLPAKPRVAALLHAAGDPENGRPELMRMVECLGRFLPSRLPGCRLLDDFTEGLNSDIFMYAGHGSGSQLLRLDDLQELRVRAVVLLMGCESGRFRHYGGNAMYWGAPHAYHVSASPCVLGSLWTVMDRPLNSLTVALLHCWLPLGTSAPALEAHVDTAFVHPLWKRSAQPELLRAVAVARANSNDSACRLGFVARGLPVLVEHGQ